VRPQQLANPDQEEEGGCGAVAAEAGPLTHIRLRSRKTPGLQNGRRTPKPRHATTASAAMGVVQEIGRSRRLFHSGHGR